MIVTKIASQALSDFQIGPWFLIGSNGIPRYHSQRVYLEYQIENRFWDVWIPTVKLKIPGKSIFEIRNQNFCYIQVTSFDIFHNFSW